MRIEARRCSPILIVALVVAFLAPAEPAAAQSLTIQDFMRNPALSRGLSDAESRELHEQFRALPEAERRAFLQSRRSRAPRGRTSLGPAPTLQYDGGVSNGFRIPNGNIVGNQFNTGFANPHSITTVTIQFGGTFNGHTVAVFGAPVGSVAPLLSTVLVSTPTLGVPVPVAVGPLTNLSGTFLVGINQSGTTTTANTTFEHVAIDTVSAGFGFHGMSITTGFGGFNPSPAAPPQGGPFNAIVRATGNNLPVELMEFGVDE